MRFHCWAPFFFVSTMAMASCQIPHLPPHLEIADDTMSTAVQAYTVESGEGVGRTLNEDEQKTVLAHVQQTFESSKSPDFVPFYWDGDEAQPHATQQLGDAVYHVLDRLCTKQVETLNASTQSAPEDQVLRTNNNGMIKQIDAFKNALIQNWSLTFMAPKDRKEVVKELPLPCDVRQPS